MSGISITVSIPEYLTNPFISVQLIHIMRNYLYKNIYFIVILVLIIGCEPELFPELPPPWNHNGTQPDENLQDFTLVDPTGASISASDFRGNAILLTFFAAWADEGSEEARWLGCQPLNPGFQCYIENHKPKGFNDLIVLTAE